MSDWTAGYVADIGYTHGYYPELNPLRVKLAFLNAGFVVPEFGAACELGFGQGLSANIHAAASITKWHGTDFNPSQASYAQELAGASGSEAQLLDEAFTEFVCRSDLPDFDFIGLHGIWSWVSDENRAAIVDFIRRKLKVGGVLYVSYNTYPGWSTFAPMRHLLTEHAEVIGSEGRGIVSRIDDAIGFAERLLDTNPIYARANPQIAERVRGLKNQNRNYLAHEYFNRDWHPMHFATMAEWLAPAKVSFACSASLIEHIDVVNLTTEQQAFLAEIPDPMFRQSVRDFMVNQQFRKDYWVKGPRALTIYDRVDELRSVKIILTVTRSDVPLKITGILGEVSLNADVYGPILDALADHKPQSLGKLEGALANANVNIGQIVQACVLLSASGFLALVQDDNVIHKSRRSSDKLNAHLIGKARSSDETTVLSSPVTGGGVTVGRFAQLFLLALSQGKKLPAEQASFVWKFLATQGQKIVKDGQPLETVEENIEELTSQAQTFSSKQLPILKALQIV
jgi:SAM-dependent methyltransferase